MKLIDKFRKAIKGPVKKVTKNLPAKKMVTTEIKTDPGSLLQQAIKSGIAISELKELLNIYKEWEAGKAEKRYFEALAGFQGACPEIKKTTKVLNKDGTLRYKYTKIDSIIKQIKGCLTQNGLSYTMKYEPSEKTKKVKEYNKYAKKEEEKTIYYMFVICEVHHIDGHTEKTPIEVPMDTSPYMTNIQQVGSTHTYGNRYAICGAFGIVTADEDDDGQASSVFDDKPVFTKTEKVEDANIVYTQDTKKTKKTVENQKPIPRIIQFVLANQKKILAKGKIGSDYINRVKANPADIEKILVELKELIGA